VVERVGRDWKETTVCMRCAAIRRRMLSNTGYLTGKGSWTYPDPKYLSPIGRMGRDGNAALRLERIRRFGESES
jgi:hypothetical protein